MERADAVSATAHAFEQIARSGFARQLVYKKIDSTLRGHVGAELQAALAAAPLFAGAIVAPAFPEQGRTLSGGRLRVQGRPADELGHPGDLMGMLDAAGLRPALLSQPQQDPGTTAPPDRAGAAAAPAPSCWTRRTHPIWRAWPRRWLRGGSGAPAGGGVRGAGPRAGAACAARCRSRPGPGRAAAGRWGAGAGGNFLQSVRCAGAAGRGSGRCARDPPGCGAMAGSGACGPAPPGSGGRERMPTRRRQPGVRDRRRGRAAVLACAGPGDGTDPAPLCRMPAPAS